jgi:voltage-dependent potassium channel beta subunit
MKYRRAGKSGLKISEISLGAWLTFGRSVDEKKSERIIKTALDSGVNFIDIADVYAKGKAEEVVGKCINGAKRSDLVISSKVFWPMSENINDKGLSRKHILESINKSLKRIGTEYLDIYFCHRPDPETEIDETVRAMSDLISQGKVIYWGTSVWEPAQIDRAVSASKEYNGYAPIVEQPRYNMLDRHIEDKIMPTCSKYGIGFTVWSPLAEGVLTGKYNDKIPPGSRGADSEWMKKDLSPESLAIVRELSALAETIGITLSQLALAWILNRDEISCAIVGATNEVQLEENLKASEVTLSGDTLSKIETILRSV